MASKFDFLGEDDALSEALFALNRSVPLFNPFKGFRFSTYVCNCMIRALLRRREKVMSENKTSQLDDFAIPSTPVALTSDHSEYFTEQIGEILSQGVLSEEEKKIVRKRFMMSKKSTSTLQQLGDEAGLSKERIRQIQNRALKKLRAELQVRAN